MSTTSDDNFGIKAVAKPAILPDCPTCDVACVPVASGAWHCDKCDTNWIEWQGRLIPLKGKVE